MGLIRRVFQDSVSIPNFGFAELERFLEYLKFLKCLRSACFQINLLSQTPGNIFQMAWILHPNVQSPMAPPQISLDIICSSLFQVGYTSLLSHSPLPAHFYSKARRIHIVYILCCLNAPFSSNLFLPSETLTSLSTSLYHLSAHFKPQFQLNLQHTLTPIRSYQPTTSTDQLLKSSELLATFPARWIHVFFFNCCTVKPCPQCLFLC